MLTAAGLTPTTDVTMLAMSLGETTSAMAAGSIDGMFWSGGLPDTGVSDLFRRAGTTVRMLATDGLVPALARLYGDGTYPSAILPRATYSLAADVPTIAEPNLLAVAEDMPADLAYQLTGLLFGYRAELAAVHPAAGGITRDTAPRTGPVPLHPGASRYYAG